MTSSREVSVRAPAKVNLGLAVGGVRADGNHEIATVFHAVSLFDDLVAAPADDISVSLEGPPVPGVPLDGTNLAARAAHLLAERTGIVAGAHLRLRKGIPVAGGMAGGSADAAAALVACDALWHTGLTREELREIGAELGADVPFSLLGGTAIGTGRGEELTPALARGEYHWVIATAGFGLSTPAVYAELDRLRSRRTRRPVPHVPDRLMQALRSGDPEALGDALENDLQAAACSLAPSLDRTLAVGREHHALGGVVSGSGPSVAFLARGHEHALELAVALEASGTVRDARRAHGPVPGARVVEAVRA